MKKFWGRVFPFIYLFEKYGRDDLRADLISGLTVALVLIPQSLAYAQLAGLPAYYGLYAAFLPPIVASLFGSSRQLSTGPVAMVALMSATALAPLAATGSEGYIAYAIALSLLVGLFQLILGIMRLGVAANFLAHPVVNGFTNAAAIIIAASQLDKIFGVTVEAGAYQYETVWRIIKAAVAGTHFPTLLLALTALAIMLVIRRISPRLPYIIAAVILTTFLSWAISFEKNRTIDIRLIKDSETMTKIDDYNTIVNIIANKSLQRTRLNDKLDSLRATEGDNAIDVVNMQARRDVVTEEINALNKTATHQRNEIRKQPLISYMRRDGKVFYSIAGPDDKNELWHIKVGHGKLNTDSLLLIGGGAVVGFIPDGLPAMKMPELNWRTVQTLFPMAMVIALLAFMEAISIAKAMASRGGYRLDANQELIGQGLSNIVSAFSRSIPVTGSFARSALNFESGAVSCVSGVVAGIITGLVLLFFTPFLYHLPQAVLAAVIIVAVFNLINVRGFIHTWKARHYDGLVGMITFAATLILAPHLDRGIIIGIILSGLSYLYRTMKPKIAMLARHEDGSYRNRERFGLGQCPYIAVVRYQGSLYFANVDYLETYVMNLVETMPNLKQVHFVGNGINEIDASGEEMLETLFDRLRRRDLRVTISGLNDAVLEAIQRTGFYDKIGDENMFRDMDRTLEATWYDSHLGGDEKICPLKAAPYFRPLPTTDNIAHDDPRYSK